LPDSAYQLTLGGEPVDDAFYGDVRSLTVEETTAGQGTAVLRLTLSKDQGGAWSYLDDERLAPFARLDVAVGFSGGLASALGALGSLLSGGSSGLETVFSGYVTGVALHLGAEPADAQLEVRAGDPFVLMGLEQKTVAWPDLADSDIVQQIVAAYGFEVDATPTSPVHSEDDTLVVQRASDADFVRRLARRHAYEAFFRASSDGPPTCRFGPPDLGGSPLPDLAVQFGDDSNLVAFDASLDALRPLAVSAAQVDARSKQTATGEADSSDLAPLGASSLDDLVQGPLASLVTPNVQQGRMLVAAVPTADVTELTALAQAVRDEAAWMTTASGEVNCTAYGNVLRAGRLVLVKGAGTTHSGRYYLTRVRHVFQSDGSYRQLFEARRNARDLDGSEGFGDELAAGLGAALP
jgi:phage protein D